MATILGNPLIIGTASARLKYSFTGTYQEREDGTIEFLSSGTFRLYKAMEVDMWGIGAGGAGHPTAIQAARADLLVEAGISPLSASTHWQRALTK